MIQPPSKSCGPCSFCCKVMSITELDKPVGRWCQHAKKRGGCAIYGAHPHSCQVFSCQWLMQPELPEEFRPDKSGVVLHSEVDGQRLVAHCDPARPVAWRREPMFTFLRDQASFTWPSDKCVVAKAGKRLWFIAPAEEIDLGEVDERSPLETIKHSDGRATVKVLDPIPEGVDVDQAVAALSAGLRSLLPIAPRMPPSARPRKRKNLGESR